MGEGIGEIT